MPLPAVQLRSALPGYGNSSLSLDDQARTVLHLLIDYIDEPAQSKRPIEDFQLCPNCDVPTASLASPYCSTDCRDLSAFVRQFRAAIVNGSILTSEKQIVFGERLWWLLGGGLPRRESMIPGSAIRQVRKRSGGRCETCGDPMSTVENFGSGCNRPLHLRAACAACAKTKGYTDVEFGHSPEVVKRLSDLSERVGSDKPIRMCDDPETWDWRIFLQKRRNLGK